MEETAPDRKPGRVLALYVPLALGVLTAAFSVTDCDCEVTFPKALMEVTGGSIVGFFLWWIVVMVCFHAYHFVCGLFHHPS